MGCHMHLVPQPLSSCSIDPLDCTALCSSIPNRTPVVNEDQSINGVSVAKQTCFVIHEEYDWEHEHQPVLKDDPLLSTPPLLIPDIFVDSTIPNFSCISPSMDAPIVHHPQNTLDVSLLHNILSLSLYSLFRDPRGPL